MGRIDKGRKIRMWNVECEMLYVKCLMLNVTGDNRSPAKGEAKRVEGESIINAKLAISNLKCRRNVVHNAYSVKRPSGIDT